jgi:hypothetical protein
MKEITSVKCSEDMMESNAKIVITSETKSTDRTKEPTFLDERLGLDLVSGGGAPHNERACGGEGKSIRAAGSNGGVDEEKRGG